MKTIEDVGPSKLLDHEQQRIRYAADNLIFCPHLEGDIEAQAALIDVEDLCRSLVEAGRWEEVSATRLADDLFQCGPAKPAILQAA
jgi:hypothetical protein